MRRLLIFVKDPVPGRVKTRLAAEIGDEAACQIYRACAELTLERLAGFHKEAVLCVDPPEAVGSIQRWLGSGWMLRGQQGATLGERLAEATNQAFASGAARVVVVGTDSPWLAPEEVRQAFTELEQAELVLGPTDDGGYYLVGLAKPLPALFEDVAWSSPQVYAQTLAHARACGLRVRHLPRGYDIDYLRDVTRFLEAERRRGRLPAAAQAIEACSQRRAPCLS